MIIYILFFVKRSHKIFYNKKRTAGIPDDPD